MIKLYKITELCARRHLNLNWDQDDDYVRAFIEPPINGETKLLITFDKEFNVVQIAYRENDCDFVEIDDAYNRAFELVWSEIHNHDKVTNKFSERRLVALSKGTHCDWLHYLFY